MKTKILGSVSVLAFIGSAALAADLPSTKSAPVAPPPAFTWNGFYLGAYGGADFAGVNVNQAGFEHANLGATGATLGGIIGYNLQFGNVVTGLEADIGWKGLNRSGNFIDGATGLPYNEKLQSGHVGRMRGRLGYAFDKTLVFAAGGLALSDGRLNLTDKASGATASVNNDLIGWTIGAGVDYAFTPNLTGRLEYIHDSFGALQYNMSGANTPAVFNDRNVRMADDTIRASLIYNFGQGVSAAEAPAYPVDPDYTVKKLDSLGDSFFVRLYNYYALEWGQSGAPIDPAAPPSRRAGWTPPPESSPPMPFVEYSYGGTTNFGVNRVASVDSPLMVALGPTTLGKFMADWGLQLYGWVNVGANGSTSHLHDGGNFPASYIYSPNTVSLDQAVAYFERTPDTVQKDHIDWGFRFSAIYGENYRYTTAYGIASWQYLNHNDVNGYDFPMVYGEVFIPQVMEGLMVRFGRYISLPDIEAQLAPNNYMYTHSMTYAFDNYTNTGVQLSLAVNKNLFIQPGVSIGSDTAIWNWGAHLTNLMPGNPLYPGTTFLKDPGATPSYTLCVRYQTDNANDNVFLCAEAMNHGQWGYNNLQWIGGTYYHRFDEKWHLGLESWNIHMTKVPNLDNPVAANIIAGGGTPFSPQFIPFNASGAAHCKNATQLYCNSVTQTFLGYLNYQFSPLDNLTFRAEYFDDMNGQRTGVATDYAEVAIGWQHWFSPQIEVRPELSYYRSFQADAFNGNSNFGIAPNRNWEAIAAGDVIFHF